VVHQPSALKKYFKNVLDTCLPLDIRFRILFNEKITEHCRCHDFKNSRRDLFIIDDRFIFRNTVMKLGFSLALPFYLKQVWEEG